MSAAEVLRRAAERIELLAVDTPVGPWRDVQDGWCLRSEPSPDRSTWRTVADSVNPDALGWLETFTPQVAGPLVAWLRAAADAADSYPITDGVHGRIMRAAGQPAAYRHTVEFVEHASAVARAVLGEEVS